MYLWLQSRYCWYTSSFMKGDESDDILPHYKDQVRHLVGQKQHLLVKTRIRRGWLTPTCILVRARTSRRIQVCRGCTVDGRTAKGC